MIVHYVIHKKSRVHLLAYLCLIVIRVGWLFGVCWNNGCWKTGDCCSNGAGVDGFMSSRHFIHFLICFL